MQSHPEGWLFSLTLYAAGTALAKYLNNFEFCAAIVREWRLQKCGCCAATNPEKARSLMEIRFISSLTAEDEDMFAPAVLKAVSALLDQLPIAYTMRIETSGSHVYQHTHVAAEDAAAERIDAGSNLHGIAFPVGSRNHES